MGCVKLFWIGYAASMILTTDPETPKGYRHPAVIIKHAIYLYHRFSLSYRDVQELLFERAIAVSHETVRAWCIRFGPDTAEQLRSRGFRRGRTWHADEMHVVINGIVHWLWRAVNEFGEVLEILLQSRRDTEAAKRFFERLLDHHDVPDVIVTDKLGSYAAAITQMIDLESVAHECVRADAHQNNTIEQSHRPTRDQERAQRGFRSLRRAQAFLVAHAGFSNAFRRSRGRVGALERRENLARSFERLNQTALRLA